MNKVCRQECTCPKTSRQYQGALLKNITGLSVSPLVSHVPVPKLHTVSEEYCTFICISSNVVFTADQCLQLSTGHTAKGLIDSQVLYLQLIDLYKQQAIFM